jgi:restriction system protein
MAVPDFQTWFLPLLTAVSDGGTHRMNHLYDVLADHLVLSAEDRAELLPSGKQFTYRNRIAWARTYLQKAGLIKSPGKGLIQITDEGRVVAAKPPQKLNVAYLKQYPSFVEFHAGTAPALPDTTSTKVDANNEETPQETFERLHKGLSSQLEAELLDQIKAAPPEFFERLVVDLLLLMGYGGSREDAGQTVGKSGDGGIDGIINEDPLGLDTVCIQAKRWEGTVGRPVVQAFAGSLEGFRAKKGVLITTSGFSADAIAYTRQIEKRIVLIDGTRLAKLMVQHNLGVSTTATYELKRVDSDYFEEG